MNYTKAILDVEFFEVEDVITTSSDASAPPKIPDAGPNILPVAPEPPAPTPGDEDSIQGN